MGATFTSPHGPGSNGFSSGDLWEVIGRRVRFDGAAWQPVAYLGQSIALAASGGASLDWTQGETFTLTPTQSQNVNCATAPPAGYQATLIVLTAGTSSYTQTFNTNFLSTGTLATGTADAKTFVMRFVSNGTKLCEISRTTAM